MEDESNLPRACVFAQFIGRASHRLHLFADLHPLRYEVLQRLMDNSLRCEVVPQVESAGQLLIAALTLGDGIGNDGTSQFADTDLEPSLRALLALDYSQ